jgi:hypothetical protein
MDNFILARYLAWQLYDVPRALLAAWKNFLRFNLDYFSIPVLLRTYFSYWRKYSSSYGRGFNMGRYFETFIFNMMSRIIGAILRTFFIILGLISELFIIIAGAAALLVWLVSPLILIFGLFLGIKMIIF